MIKKLFLCSLLVTNLLSAMDGDSSDEESLATPDNVKHDLMAILCPLCKKPVPCMSRMGHAVQFHTKDPSDMPYRVLSRNYEAIRAGRSLSEDEVAQLKAEMPEQDTSSEKQIAFYCSLCKKNQLAKSHWAHAVQCHQAPEGHGKPFMSHDDIEAIRAAPEVKLLLECNECHRRKSKMRSLWRHTMMRHKRDLREGDGKFGIAYEMSLEQAQQYANGRPIAIQAGKIPITLFLPTGRPVTSSQSSVVQAVLETASAMQKAAAESELPPQG